MAEVAHQRHDIAGHGPLGRLPVTGRVRRQGGLAVTAQVRTDHEERASQQRRHPVPGRMRAGMAVQQHHRPPLAAVPHAQGHLADIDAVQPESIEHGPAPTPRGPARTEST